MVLDRVGILLGLCRRANGAASAGRKRSPSCPKTRTEPKSRVLEAFSKFAETSRRGCDPQKKKIAYGRADSYESDIPYRSILIARSAVGR